MDNLQQLIETLGITLTAVDAPFNPMMEDSSKMFHWACSLSVKDRPIDGFNVVFSKGGGFLEVNPKFKYWMVDGATNEDVQRIKDNIGSYYYDFDRKLVLTHFGRLSGWESILASKVLQAAPPTAEEVLDCLLSEAYVLDYDSFEDWANDFGFNSDSIKAQDTFHHIRKQSKNLIKLLGRKNFQLAMEMECL